MSTWPSDLPQLFQIDGYAGGLPDGRIFSATDTGPGKVRVRSTAMVEPVAGSMIMTWAQIIILEIFWIVDCGRGALVFDFPDPRSNPASPTMRKTRFMLNEPPPSWQPLGGEAWLVSFKLEFLP